MTYGIAFKNLYGGEHYCPQYGIYTSIWEAEDVEVKLNDGGDAPYVAIKLLPHHLKAYEDYEKRMVAKAGHQSAY